MLPSAGCDRRPVHMPSLTFPFIPVCHFNLIRHASLDNPIVYSGRARRHACLVEGCLPYLGRATSRMFRRILSSVLCMSVVDCPCMGWILSASPWGLICKKCRGLTTWEQLMFLGELGTVSC